MIQTRIITGKKELQTFINLPKHLHKNHKLWVPPIYSDEQKYYNHHSNPSFLYCETVLALCYQNETPVGRIMGIINHRYNKIRSEKYGRFSWFESINDQEVSNSLLEFTENWAKEKGMSRLIGPYGMNYLDPEGFIIEGFEYPPTIATNYNFEYYLQLLKESGYEKENDYVVYKIDLPNKIPDLYYRIRERILKTGQFELVEFSTKNELRKNTLPLLKLMNQCFTEITGYSFLDEREIAIVGKQYISLLDPRFIKVVKYKSEMVGFIIAMPHISEGLRKSKGKLFPFGFLKILTALKNSKQIDLLLGGVKQQYRAIGIDVLLGMSIIETAVKAGFILLDSHHELDKNVKVRAEMEKMGGTVYKKYRVFSKNLR